MGQSDKDEIQNFGDIFDRIMDGPTEFLLGDISPDLGRQIDDFVHRQARGARRAITDEFNEALNGPAEYVLQGISPNLGRKIDNFVEKRVSEIRQFFEDGVNEVGGKLKEEYQQLRDLGVADYLWQNSKTVLKGIYNGVSDLFSGESPEEKARRIEANRRFLRKMRELLREYENGINGVLQNKTAKAEVKCLPIEGEGRWYYTTVDGKLHGAAIHVDENGNNVETKYFYHGQRVDSIYFDSLKYDIGADGKLKELAVTVNGEPFGVNVSTDNGQQRVVVADDGPFVEKREAVDLVLRHNLATMEGSLPNSPEAMERNVQIAMAYNRVMKSIEHIGFSKKDSRQSVASNVTTKRRGQTR